MEDMPDSDSGTCKGVRVQLPPCAHAPLAQMEEHLTFNQGGMGSIPLRRTMLEVAQLAEHRIVAPAVGSSNLLFQPTSDELKTHHPFWYALSVD